MNNFLSSHCQKAELMSVTEKLNFISINQNDQSILPK